MFCDVYVHGKRSQKHKEKILHTGKRLSLGRMEGDRIGDRHLGPQWQGTGLFLKLDGGDVGIHYTSL